MKALLKKYKEIISYLFWGVMTTVVSWGTYSVFAILFRKSDVTFALFGLELSSAVIGANVLSWICAVAFAFVTNKLWVFESKSWLPAVFLPELWKFVAARLATGVIEMAGVPLLVGVGLNQTIFGIEGAVAKIAVSVFVVVINYILSKLLIFNKNKQCD